MVKTGRTCLKRILVKSVSVKVGRGQLGQVNMVGLTQPGVYGFMFVGSYTDTERLFKQIEYKFCIIYIPVFRLFFPFFIYV